MAISRPEEGSAQALPGERVLAAIAERRRTLLQPKPRVIKQLRTTGLLCGVVATCYSALVFGMSLAGAHTSTGGVLGRFLAYPHMGPILSLGLMTLGVAVTLNNLPRTRVRTATMWAILSPCLLVAVAVLIARLGEGDIDLGAMLGMPDPTGSAAGGIPLPVIVVLLLTGGMLLVLGGAVSIGQPLLFAATAITLCANIGHVLRLHELYAWGGSRPLIWESAVCGFLLSIGSMTGHSGHGLAALITGNSHGGRVSRKLFWLVVLLPVFAGLVALYWLDHQVFHPRLVVGLYTLAAILSTGLVTGWISLTLRDVDIDRVSALAEVEEVTKLLAERDALAERLTRANADLEAFAAIAAHDLRSPLVAIRGYAELLQDDPTLVTPAGRRWLDRIIAGTTRGAALIQDLLTYSRASNADVPFVPLDLTELALQARHDCALPEAVTVAPLGQVYGEPMMLQQLFNNLIENAVKYVPPDRAAKVTVDAVADQESVVVRVSDNGEGIPESDRSRLVRMFERGCHGVEGSGIGLAICHRVAERHGGRLWIEDSDTGGARVCVRLPLRQ